MRALRFDGPGLPPRIHFLPVPRPRRDEALLRILAAGLCHTELQLLDGTLNPGVWPLTPGHEIVGEVVDGPSDLLGQRALVYYSRPCGECDWCAHGHEQICPDAGPQPGLSTDGGFAEYVCVPVSSLVPLPDHLDPVSAAPLGCAAATAYHALLGVACAESGETIAVYGVGGVGLPLIQLAVARGLRVLAVGRSAGKLELACQMGAEVVDASTVDTVLEVRRLTRGEGVHAVFDLVGSDESLPAALAMLRRRGRLVLVGYGSARLQVNPLQLVLRETQVLGSLGNTRDELREVVRLAAAGALQVPVAEQYALEDVPVALDALRAGQLNGRAVIVPSLSSTRPGAAADATRWSTSAGPDAHQSAEDDQTARGVGRNGEQHHANEWRARPLASVPLLVSTLPRADSSASPDAERAADGARPLEAELLAFVDHGLDAPSSDDDFNALALRLFAYQFANNRPYRLLCERRRRTPSTVATWRDIPAVPIAAFKETLLAAEPIEGAAEFNSSGTTQPERKSRHFHPSLSLYDLNAVLNFAAHVLPDRARLPLLVLFPPRHELPNSSLAHWLSLMVERWGAPGSGWFVENATGLDGPALLARLSAAHEPVGVLAASFGLVHFLEFCQTVGARLSLPPGSRVMDTGGYKGRSREYAKDELYAMVTELLGIPPTHIVNMYGMTEHGTQFLDGVLRDHVRRPAPGRMGPRFKVVPPWARTRVVDPETLVERSPGERGLLLHVDLINRASALAVLTEDIGHTVDGGFELLGRAQGSEARGCSIALDELVEALRGSVR